MFNAILRLRRDNDYNYAKIKDKFIPANGEVCLVDTARDGLRAVCGDGKTPFGQLEFIGGLIVKGYYYNDIFYSDAAHTEKIIGSQVKIYVDLHQNEIYHFNGTNYELVSSIPHASESKAGVMKLYSTTGQNTDGTMTQKAITDELDDKVEAMVISEEELLVFASEL